MRIDPNRAALLELSGFALAHALWTAPKGELVPFVLTEDADGSRELARFMTDADQAMEEAHRSPRWAMAQWGLLDSVESGGRPSHCMRVEFGRLSRSAGSVMWAFEPAKRPGVFGRMFGKRKPLRLLEGPEIAFGKRDKDLVGSSTDEARNALLAGMRSHEKAWKNLNIN